MTIVARHFTLVANGGGSGGHSATSTLRWPSPLIITAQAAVSGFGGTDQVGEVGFSSYVDAGAFHTIGSDQYGSRGAVFFGGRTTQLDVEARSYDGWVGGGAVVYAWDS
jgi:hypothetical protein